MTQASLGLIETIGLAAAVAAADAAVKSANVELVGYELAKGGGMTMVKVRGDVGAVKAAIAAATVAASAINRVVSVTVIARPAQGIRDMIASHETVGAARPEPAAEKRVTASIVPVAETPPAAAGISAAETAVFPKEQTASLMESPAGDAPRPAPPGTGGKPGGKPGKKIKR